MAQLSDHRQRRSRSRTSFPSAESGLFGAWRLRASLRRCGQSLLDLVPSQHCAKLLSEREPFDGRSPVRRHVGWLVQLAYVTECFRPIAPPEGESARAGRHRAQIVQLTDIRPARAAVVSLRVMESEVDTVAAVLRCSSRARRRPVPASALPSIVGSGAAAVATGDVTGDGARSRRTATRNAAVDFRLCSRRPRREPRSSSPYATAGSYPNRVESVAVGDIAGDGRADVVVGASSVGVQGSPRPPRAPRFACHVRHAGRAAGTSRAARRQRTLDVAAIGWGRARSRCS